MSMLQDPCYNDAIRMMREQILDEMSECDPLDKETLGMLRLRLQTVNEFSLTLAQFIDAYEELVALQREEQRKYHNQEAAA